MFITDQDYRVVIGAKALDALSQVESDIRREAEQIAINEASGYLWPTYDTDAIFSLEGSERPPRLVSVIVDIALYHMSASLPARMGTEVRDERYHRAIKWLEDVSRGTVSVNLPLCTDTDGEHSRNTYHSDTPTAYNW